MRRVSRIVGSEFSYERPLVFSSHISDDQIKAPNS